MPDAVKISELPARAAVSTDILPAIDVNFGQTVRLTASAIAAIGGGPPGDNTVTTAKLANGSVTYPKIQNVAQDRILGRATASAGVVEEIPCTPFARTVLAAPNSATAVAALGALASTVDPTFTGAVKLPDGTAAAPSLTNTGDLDTGLFFPFDNNIGISTDGYERFRIAEDGSQYSNFPGTAISTQLRAQYPVRAFLLFNGQGGGAFTISSQHTIAQRYIGVWGSLLNDASTQARIKVLEETNSGGSPTPNQTISTYSSVGTEGRTNYTTPADNVHYRWNGSAWVTVPATTGSWIGSITITNNASVTILNSGNISSVTRFSTGVFDINFVAAMPDANYAVVALPSDSALAASQALVPRLTTMTTTGFRITSARLDSGAVWNPNQFSILVLR